MRGVARRVVAVDDSRLDWTLEIPPGVVEVVLRDGRRFSLESADAPGGPRSPATWEQLAGKFADCAALASSPPSPAQVAEAVALGRSLESLGDAIQLLRVLG